MIQPSSPPTTPSDTPTLPADSFLDTTFVYLLVIALAVVLVGVILRWVRKDLRDTSGAVARSWMAIGLVIALILICVIAFAIDDMALRSTLVGALTANAGAAVAYYFSTKSSEQAQAGVLAAALAPGSGSNSTCEGEQPANKSALPGTVADQQPEPEPEPRSEPDPDTV